MYHSKPGNRQYLIVQVQGDERTDFAHYLEEIAQLVRLGRLVGSSSDGEVSYAFRVQDTPVRIEEAS